MGEVFEGSAIKTNLTVEAGETLKFDWNFLTDDLQASNNDFAFFTLSGENTKLADTFSAFSNSFNNPTSFLHQTGFQTVSYTFKTAGTYTFGVGIVDVGDGSIDSGLMIDNVSLSRLPL
jgi:plastocyanin